MYIYNFDSCFTNQTGQYHTFWNITFNFFSPEQKRLLYICSGDVHPLQVNLCISTGLVGESVTHFVQGLLQHSLRLLPPVLGHVAGCLAVEEQQGGRVLVRHLLEDVVGVLQLLSSLEWKRHVRTHLNISSHSQYKYTQHHMDSSSSSSLQDVDSGTHRIDCMDSVQC